MPAKDGAVYLGDVEVTIDGAGLPLMSSGRLIALVTPLVDAKTAKGLRAWGEPDRQTSPGELGQTGATVGFDPKAIELTIHIPSTARLMQRLQVSAPTTETGGAFDRPARLSAYLSVRGSIDEVESGPGEGMGVPILYLDGAVRAGGVVLETQALVTPSRASGSFQRQGSRVVFDVPDQALRWTFGDLQTQARDYQAAPDIAGFSVLRSYGTLQPLSIIRPTGQESFRLNRASSVQVFVNGQLVRRLQLEPGAYDLRDFPFTQGANDVRVQIQDDTGASETLRFNLFTDQSQLAAGLDEFGFYAGVKAPLGPLGPAYSHDWTASGFYRRGLTDALTLGVNGQADTHSQMAGLDATLATGLGVVTLAAAESTRSGVGAGYAVTATFQRLVQHTGAMSDSFNLSVQAWSRNFGPAGLGTQPNPDSFEITGAWSHAFSQAFSGGLNLSYARGYNAAASSHSYGANIDWTTRDGLDLTARIVSQAGGSQGHGLAFLVGVRARLGRSTNVHADYDGRTQTEQFGVTAFNGSGVGAYTLAADVERTGQTTGLNADVTYLANRAQLELNQFTSFGGGPGAVGTSRTSLHVGAAVGWADGAISIGRPVNDAFAIVTAHPSLHGAPVLVDSVAGYYGATTGVLPTALEPDLASYVPRILFIAAPDAPADADLERGSFRLTPPYRAGYRLQVGSDYSVTVIGRLLDRQGLPLAYVTGLAYEVGRPGHPLVTLFTNQDGRFGVAGLRPGRWRIVMQSEPPVAYLLDVAPKAEGGIAAGDLKPLETAP